MAKKAKKPAAPKTSRPNDSVKKLAHVTGDKTWKFDSKTRGAINAKGEKISRRQLEKKYGLLAAEGFTSFEQKAKRRKASGMKGFKIGHNFSRTPRKMFYDRQEMLDFMASIPDGYYTFRVILGGIGNEDKYKPAGDGLTYHYSKGQLAYQPPSDFKNWSIDKDEDGYIEVKSWEVTARKAYD